MNHLQTQPKSKQVNQPDLTASTTMDRQTTSIPAIEKVLESICADARTSALQYALRSDTGHDGE